ncbi:T9SS type A sorting domain-containing protein [Rapidithrix thailandica]|uniref:T9SS type A sorting domain-containing protein n=1 Tax=Rapidithrix thailandica TaxID=413964 RepID=A0AAW9S366_9BACT
MRIISLISLLLISFQGLSQTSVTLQKNYVKFDFNIASGATKIYKSGGNIQLDTQSEIAILSLNITIDKENNPRVTNGELEVFNKETSSNGIEYFSGNTVNDLAITLSTNANYSVFLKYDYYIDGIGSFTVQEDFDININKTDPDNEPPTIPSNLSASNITSNSLRLSWNASSDNKGVSGYKVYQNGVYKTRTSSTATTITGLSSCTTYNFSVRAYDASGNESGSVNKYVSTVSGVTPYITLNSDITNRKIYTASASEKISFKDGFRFKAIDETYLFKANIISGDCASLAGQHIMNKNFITKSNIAIRDTITTYDNTKPSITLLNKKENNFYSTEVSLFPNPTTDIINIAINNLSKVQYEVSIFNAYGGLVFQQKTNEHNFKVDLSNQPSGLYFVKVNSPDSLIKTIKVIKE